MKQIRVLGVLASRYRGANKRDGTKRRNLLHAVWAGDDKTLCGKISLENLSDEEHEEEPTCESCRIKYSRYEPVYICRKEDINEKNYAH